MTQNNLGGALWNQPARTEGPRGAELLAQAVTAYRRPWRFIRASSCRRTGPGPSTTWALRSGNKPFGARAPEASRTAGPGRHRLSQRPGSLHARAAAAGLGHDPAQPGHCAPGPGGSDRGAKRRRTAGQAVSAYRSALEVQDARAAAAGLGRDPADLGVALGNKPFGPRGQGSELLAQAVTAYRSALEVYTREQLPQDWAMTQNNLGLRSGTRHSDRGGKRRRAAGPGRHRLPKRPGSLHARAAAAELGRDPAEPGRCALGTGHSQRGRQGYGAAGPGRRSLPQRPGSMHARAAAAGLGNDPEQPGHCA